MAETVTAETAPEQAQGALDRALARSLTVNWEVVAWVAIVVLTLVTRLWALGDRAMSHDESLHTYYSWNLFIGKGYEHDPMMHGPLLYHATALSYFLFGVSDFTARLLGVVSGLALVLSPLLVRKWLGAAGAVAAGVMLLVSPSIAYYSRYIRHDIPVELFTVLMFVSFFLWLDQRRDRWLVVAMAAAAGAITSAEMSYINGFVLVLFIAVALIVERLGRRNGQLFGALTAAGGLGLLVFAWVARTGRLDGLATARELGTAASGTLHDLMQVSFLMAGPLIAYGLISQLFAGHVLDARTERPDDEPDLGAVVGLGPPLGIAALGAAVMVLGLILRESIAGAAAAQGATDAAAGDGTGLVLGIVGAGALLAVYGLLGWTLERAEERGLAAAIAEVPLSGLGVAAAVFIVIYTLMFTTFFTHPEGINGFFDSIQYWLDQHGVRRADQPWYYYMLIAPMYEFLPLLLALAGAVIYAVRRDWRVGRGNDSGDPDRPTPAAALFLPMLLAWTVGNFWIYSWAGEKMPWLVVHLVVPMTFIAGRLVGDVVDRVDWTAFRERGWQLAGVTVLLLVTLVVWLLQWPTFGSQEAEAQAELAGWLLGLPVIALLVWALYRISQSLSGRQARLMAALGLAGLLLVVNVRYSLLANFVNDELATEYIVYAHGTPDDKLVYETLQDMQERLGVDEPLTVAYDNEVSWPFTWYFRETDWEAARYVGESPGGVINDDVVLVGSPNYSKFEPYLRNRYVGIEYRRMWWPNEGYKGKTLSDVTQALTDPAARENLLNILLYREYEKPLTDWYHHANMKMYIKRDLIERLWPMVQARPDWLPPTAATGGQAAVESEELSVETRFEQGPNGTALAAPKGIALGPDGRLYVVDHANHRIVVFGQDGAPEATLSEGLLVAEDGQPSAWGVGVGDDGAVYIADTWNHQIRKIVDGEQTLAWGNFGQPDAGNPLAQLELFYGPRDVAVGPDGNVYVTDTGNKRITVFSPDGEPLRAIGGPGAEPGQLEEPTSLAFDPETGDLIVADLWNFRIQRFDRDLNPVAEWTVDGWDSQEAAHKAYVDVGPGGVIIASDPAGARVWLYSRDGEPLASIDLLSDERGLDLPVGVVLDPQGRPIVASSNSSVVTRYEPSAAVVEAAGLSEAAGDVAGDDAAGSDAQGDGAAEDASDGEEAPGDEGDAEQDESAGDAETAEDAASPDDDAPADGGNDEGGATDEGAAAPVDDAAGTGADPGVATEEDGGAEPGPPAGGGDTGP